MYRVCIMKVYKNKKNQEMKSVHRVCIMKVVKIRKNKSKKIDVQSLHYEGL